MVKNSSPDVVELLQKLIVCPSITPQEGGALTVLEDYLSNIGFVCHRLIFKEPGAADVENLFARLGSGEPHLCFAGHTDVVPPGDEGDWRFRPFRAEIDEGKLYGRGASDMKGSVAAFAAAVAEYVELMGKPPGSISLLITGDEEGPAINGTVKVLEWMRENAHIPTHCLVGEPSCVETLGDTMKIGRRGSLSFEVTVEGKQGHVAYPEMVDNPIPKLARFVDRISSARLDQGNTAFGPSTLAVTTFDVGNPTGNLVPARAKCRFNIRFGTEQSFESLKAWVERHRSSVEAELGGRWTITSAEGAEAFLTEPGPFIGLVQDAVAQETGQVPKLSTSGGTSDARFIKDYCPVLEFGPTNASIHQVDEHIELSQLQATLAIYRRVLERYFNNQSA